MNFSLCWSWVSNLPMEKKFMGTQAGYTFLSFTMSKIAAWWDWKIERFSGMMKFVCLNTYLRDLCRFILKKTAEPLTAETLNAYPVHAVLLTFFLGCCCSLINNCHTKVKTLHAGNLESREHLVRDDTCLSKGLSFSPSVELKCFVLQASEASGKLLWVECSHKWQKILLDPLNLFRITRYSATPKMAQLGLSFSLMFCTAVKYQKQEIFPASVMDLVWRDFVYAVLHSWLTFKIWELVKWRRFLKQGMCKFSERHIFFA